MSPADRDQLGPTGIFDFSGNEYPFSGSVIELFEQQVKSTPDAPALKIGANSWSYSELDSLADGISVSLISQGVRQGSVVGICLEKGIGFYSSVLAILKSGCAYLPFDPSYPKSRIAHMEKQAGVSVVVTALKYRDHFTASGIVLMDDERQIEGEPLPETITTPAAGDRFDLVYVLFTSGSTGNPKGVAMSNAPLTNLLQWQRTDTTLGTPARTIQFSALSFDVSFQEMFSCWTTGGTLLPVDEDIRVNAAALAEFLRLERIERMFLPYVALQQLADHLAHTDLNLPDLRDVITAGEQLKISREIRDFFSKNDRCRLHNHYGPTESHVVTSLTLEGDPGSWDELPAIGRPIGNSRIYILNEEMKPVSENETGELYIAGVPLADGYINDPEQSESKFIEDPFSDLKNDRMYRTGDLAWFGKDGYIHYSGRTDSQVKIRGYRVELAEVELAVQRQKDISDCAVKVHKDASGIDRLIAYVVTNDKGSLKMLREQLTDVLPDHMIPSRFMLIDEMPKTPSGKIDKGALPVPGRERPVMDTLFVRPETELERMLSGLWMDVLELDRVGLNDNFFELGGNSLLAIRFITLVNERAHLGVSAVDLYRKPTISGLCSIIEGGGMKKGQEPTAGLSSASKRRSVVRGQDDIAVIGMSGRFPGATDINEFWKILKEGMETTSFFTEEELDHSIPESLRNDPFYVRARGVLDDPAGFDAQFFNINPKLATLMDPQQRIFLEVAWNAIEHSGYDPYRIGRRVGVFAGSGNNTYYNHNVAPNSREVSKVGAFQVMTANEKDYIASRVSHFMDLKGPAVSVHTACSTSLVAVIMACESIRAGHCEMAIAGGVSVTSPVNSGHLYQEGSMFSKDGHTRPFDDDASGTVFSDGAGAVILKNYHRAVEDGDNIIGMIRGLGINNDGSDKASFTAPSVEGQSNAIRMAIEDAGIDPSTITYIETHGTATPLGDPIEIEGIRTAFGRQVVAGSKCALGSVKSNFGHLTAAAGVAGLIKTLLMMQHKSFVPTVNFKKLNGRIDMSGTPFYISDSHASWVSDGSPLRAGVSSFGVGGTNAHVILESVPERKASGPARPASLLMLSAKNGSSLEATFNAIEQYVIVNGDINPADVCYTLQTGRAQFNNRKYAVITQEKQESSHKAVISATHSGQGVLNDHPAGLVFMFPGQGSQYAGMGKLLYRDELVFKEAVEECAMLFSEHLGIDFLNVLFDEEKSTDPLINQTIYTQPALFTMGYALAKLLMHWGLKPSALIGHSIGEFTAACISGIMDLKDAVLVVSSRGKLMQELPRGSMLSVRMSESDLSEILPSDLSVAAVNGKELCVVSGNDDSILDFQSVCNEKEVVTRLLHTSHAFHSVMMEPAMEPFREVLNKVKLNVPKIPVMSTSLAGWLKDSEATDPGYWVDHIRKTVRFAEGIRLLWDHEPSFLMVELGPRNTASVLARQQASDHNLQKAVSTLGSSPSDEWISLLNAIGQLWVAGITINWDKFYELENRQRVGLPGYRFSHERYWIDPPGHNTTRSSGHVLPGSVQVSSYNDQMVNKANDEMNDNDKRSVVIADLKSLIEDASGIDLSTASDSKQFIELGLDSLFLTQIALSISRKYDTRITFRQLNEGLSSLGLLADHIINNAPALSFDIPSPSALSSQAEGAVSDVQNLILQQMQMMQQQLDMLRKEHGSGGAVGNNPISSPSVPRDSESEKAESSKPFGAIARIEKETSNDLTDEQIRWLDEFTGRYNSKTGSSKSYTQQHRSHLADPRVVSGFKPALKELIYQVVVDRSDGNRLWDLDGNEYIDVLNGFGSNFLGYGSEVVKKAVIRQLEEGIEIGPQHPLAGEVAKLICDFTGYDRAGFCNTGSEAVLGALRIARTYTGRSLVVCFNGSYHGINDEVIVRGTRNLRSIPAAAGIMPESVQNMLVLDYGTDKALEVIRSRADEIAAVLVEPVQSRRADFKPKEFLSEVRKITKDHGSLLIFDEVITGFRMLPGGAQEYYSIDADVSTYGKVIGGGMPIGVIAGKREFMDTLDGGDWRFGDDSVPESGVTYFAGTFVRHPLALAAAKATLVHLKERGDEFWENLNGMTARLVATVNDHCINEGLPFRLVTFGSLFKVKWLEESHYGELLFARMREEGVHIYDGFPCFVTDAFNVADIDRVADTFIRCADELADVGFIKKRTGVNGSASDSGDADSPPVEGAKLGTLPNGKKGWFVPDPDRPGKYLQVKDA